MCRRSYSPQSSGIKDGGALERGKGVTTGVTVAEVTPPREVHRNGGTRGKGMAKGV